MTIFQRMVLALHLRLAGWHVRACERLMDRPRPP